MTDHRGEAGSRGHGYRRTSAVSTPPTLQARPFTNGKRVIYDDVVQALRDRARQIRRARHRPRR